jgi:hypothetical protein
MAELSNLYSELSTKSDGTTGNGSTTDFILTSTPKSELDVLVFVNGLKLRYTTHYTVTLATKTVSFVTAPAAGQNINIVYKYV